MPCRSSSLGITKVEHIARKEPYIYFQRNIRPELSSGFIRFTSCRQAVWFPAIPHIQPDISDKDREKDDVRSAEFALWAVNQVKKPSWMYKDQSGFNIKIKHSIISRHTLTDAKSFRLMPVKKYALCLQPQRLKEFCHTAEHMMLQPSICPASELLWSVFMCSNPSDRTHTISTNRTSRARVMGMQTKKGCSFLLGTAFLRDSDRIQTCNLLIRSQMLYSVELRSLVSCLRLQRYAYFLFPPNFFRYFFVFSSKNIRKSIFRLLFPLQYGQGYVIFHGKEPYRTYYQE